MTLLDFLNVLKLSLGILLNIKLTISSDSRDDYRGEVVLFVRKP